MESSMQDTSAPPSKAAVRGLLSSLESLWSGFDELFDSVGPTDWSRRHGPDWTFADVPYHLAYFDRLMVDSIQRGTDVLEAEQHVLPTYGELNAWNARKFAERPADQTPEESLREMRDSREAMRRVAASLDDPDLGRPAFIMLPGCGWLTAGAALGACLMHTWSHFVQLRSHLERDTPSADPKATHAAVAFMMGMFGMVLDRDEARDATFTAVMDFTGPGGGAWTIRVANSQCTVAEGGTDPADVVMTQTPETFELTRVGMIDPIDAMQRGLLSVQGLEKMSRFGQLFPPPTLDRVIEPAGAFVAAG